MNLVRLPGGAIVNLDNLCFVARDGTNEIGSYVMVFGTGIAIKVSAADMDFLSAGFGSQLDVDQRVEPMRVALP
jgi:hypothetical protein